MTAVRLRLCDEDLERFGGPEWVTFDQAELDDLPVQTLNEFELELNQPLKLILGVHQRLGMELWKAAAVWMGRKMAGIETPGFAKFDIKSRKMQVEDLGGDVDPPSSPTSSEPVSEEV